MPENTPQSTYSEVFKQHKSTALRLRSESIVYRREKLKRLKDWLWEHRSAIHDGLYEDLKKPASEADITELYPILSEVRLAISRLKVWSAPRAEEGSLSYLGTKAYTYFEPKGTSLIISPWNYPLLLSLGPLISAITAGNTAILKPSEYTPGINRVISEMIHALFSPEEILLVEGEAETASELLRLPFDHVFFTGSPEVGKKIMSAAAKHLSSVTLELGGKSPAIVDRTANLYDAARKIAWGKWTNAGQTCVAPDYLLVHEDVQERFVQLLVKQIDQLYSNQSEYGGIINERHFRRLEKYVMDAEQKGARAILKPKFDADSSHISPGIYMEISDEMLLMEEEIFGPILPILVYKDHDEAISYINNRPKPLAFYSFSRKRRLNERFLRETSSGTAVINDCVLHFGHPHLPIGGVNNSGIGKAHGHAGFLAFSNERAVLKQRRGLTMARMVYPPYSKLKKKIIDLMLKYF